jgi:hypothetical protein
MKEQFEGAPPVIRNTSRAYRNQAMALIGVCRFFSQFVDSEQGQEQEAEFKA